MKNDTQVDMGDSQLNLKPTTPSRHYRWIARVETTQEKDAYEEWARKEGIIELRRMNESDVELYLIVSVTQLQIDKIKASKWYVSEDLIPDATYETVVGPDGVNSSCDEDSGQDMDQLKPHLVMANEVPTLLVDTDKTSDVAIMEFAKGLKLALEEVPRMQADPCATLLSGDEFVATEIESFDPKGFQHKPQPLMIAIVDTGVGILDEERIVLRENVTPDGEKSDSVDDEHGHGTHIFGIVRALAPPNAKFQIYKNIDSTGTWMDYTLRAIERAIENKADLVCVASSPSRVMGRKLMEQMDHIIETASNTKIFLAAGNDKQICHWPRETHSHPFVLIGSKNLSQEWSDFCLCTDRPLHPSFGQAIISNRSASLKGSLTKLTLDKFNWHTPLPTHLTHKDYLIMQGTSQATAFYTGVHTFQTDNVEQLCWDIAKQLKAYNVVARKQ